MSQFFLLFKKIDETISLDNLQKLKLAFEVNGTITLRVWLCISETSDCIFFLVKEFETDGLRSTDAKNFGRIVKKCLGLSNTVRQRDISLYISLSPSPSSLCSLCLASLQLRTSLGNYLTNLQWVSLRFSLLFFEFHRAMHRFKGYLRRLIIQAMEGFHGWDEIHICSFLFSVRCEPLHAC